MENKAHALAAGIFVLVASALLAALAVWLTSDKGTYDLYEISTRETVTGLQAQAPVRYRGVDVGKVASIGFDPQTPGNVLMRLQVAREAPMNQSTFATLSFQGVTGLAFVQLDDKGQPGAPLVPNDEQPPRIPLKPGLLSELAEKSKSILEKVEQATTRLSDVLAPDNQKRLATALENTGRAADSVAALSSRMQGVLDAQLGPQRVDIPLLVKDVSATMKSLQATSQSAGVALDEVTRTARRLNEKDGPIDRLAEGTEALSAAADSFNAATLPRINQVTDDTARAARRLSRTVNAINDNPQSLIFGNGAAVPGPGEPGFNAPGVAR
ncbi:MAG: MCE family protein [Ramlibacter sp.]|nr:MCE family protein [Ramlibacter sp.]